MQIGKIALPVGVILAGVSYIHEPQDAAVTYITAPVERSRIATYVKASGAVAAVETVDISSQLSGRVAKVLVDFNDKVKVGQSIAELDQEIFAAVVKEADAALRVARAATLMRSAAVERAKAGLAMARSAKELAEQQAAAFKARQDEAETELRRKTVLARSGSGSERELEQAQALRNSGAADLRAALAQVQVKAEAISIAQAEALMAEADLANAQVAIEQKEAELAHAKADFDRTVLRSPIDGTVIKRDVNPGQTVAVSLEAKTLFTIANDLRAMEVHGMIDEADVGQLRIGQEVEFRVDAYPGRTFSGQILQIRKNPEVTQNVVTYTAIISAPNPDLLLFPGMTAQLRILVNDTGEVLKIPAQALRFHPKDRGGIQTGGAPAVLVWIVDSDGRPKPVAVTIGASDDLGSAMIDGRLKEGQSVIIGAASPAKQRTYFGLRMGF
jgi:HlyD family secretion protein